MLQEARHHQGAANEGPGPQGETPEAAGATAAENRKEVKDCQEREGADDIGKGGADAQALGL